MFDMVEVEFGCCLYVVCEGFKEVLFVLYDVGVFGIYIDGWWV